jgi:CheY-like chemotaxis protein
MAKKIMVVDDEPRLVSLLEAYLSQEGFSVVAAGDGREAQFLARQEKPDLIVLDLMMPEMDGYEFMRMHRKEQETPIIMLTAKVDEQDKVLGLELGAEDYLTKSFRPRELVARVRAVLRRVGETRPSAKVLRAADITLDRERHTVYGIGYRFAREYSRRVSIESLAGAQAAALLPGGRAGRHGSAGRAGGHRYQGRVCPIHARPAPGQPGGRAGLLLRRESDLGRGPGPVLPPRRVPPPAHAGSRRLQPGPG